MLNLEKSLEAFKDAKTLMPGGVNSPVRSFRGVDGNPPFIARGAGDRTLQDVPRGRLRCGRRGIVGVKHGLSEIAVLAFPKIRGKHRRKGRN